MYKFKITFTTKLRQMHEIKIYGEIVSTYQKDNGAKGYSLVDLQNDLAKAEGKEIRVRFNSPGGDVQEGFAMYDELRRYAKENKTKVHTFAEANLASIATVPFLSGDTRTISKTIEPFVHNAWNEAIGDARMMRDNADELERCNDKIARHYSDHTDLTYKEARELMNNETSITAKEAVVIKFATAIEKVSRPAALLRFSTNNNDNKMTKPKGKLARIMAILAENGIKNKIVYTAEQTEVDFYELEEDEPIEVGANAKIDGAEATGEHVMENGDTYVFEAGVLTEIREKNAEGDGTEEEMAALKAEIAELKAAAVETQTVIKALKTQNKAYAKSINLIKALEAEFTEPASTPAARRPVHAPEKGSKASAAIGNFINTKIKK
jgi:ATP-dependent protease ClpP protease subunit